MKQRPFKHFYPYHFKQQNNFMTTTRNHKMPPIHPHRPWTPKDLNKPKRGSFQIDPQQRHETSTLADISKDMIAILRQENANLKEQNRYLLSQMRIFVDKDKHHQEIQKKYQEIIQQLKSKIQDLEWQVKELNSLAKFQMRKLGQKIQQMATDGNESREAVESVNRSKAFSLSGFMSSQQMRQRMGNQTLQCRQIQQLERELKRLMVQQKHQMSESRRMLIQDKMSQISKKIRQIKKMQGCE